MTVKPETARELLDQAAKRIRESGVLIQQAQCMDDDMRDAIDNAYLQLALLRARFEAFQEAVDRWRS